MNFSYHLIYTLAAKTEEEVNLVNKCYALWADEYGKDLASRGATLNRDEFQRARVLAIIMDGSELVGFHQYTVFDLREICSHEHSYVRALGQEVLSKMLDQKIKSFMAMEYLTVAPSFRGKGRGGPKISEIIIRLGLRVMNELGADAALGIARIDRKVNSTGDAMGWRQLAEIKKYNNPCAVMLFEKTYKEIPSDDFTNRLVDSLWIEKHKVAKIAA
ncbi:hypothetical protein B9G69_014200 [Bdellovibrio sp. SKB1291214]|uniref:hypothetical protein n=1 Tax=Bdellovibrio sp. SKB1291214 TaxID=1732569 RepID=UPI000B51DC64|nr:hypothetical protein [Bdellovibrio sp. SKB1291214]UYL08200.1 hypothetical protein B9G69_014200 [Bdellovibrio sp. SKB1291214]